MSDDSRVRRLVELFRLCWAVPVIAEIQRTSGSKFVTLANRLGLSRDSLKRTLDTLIERGWVARNEGFGHPMRPEYVLTGEGARLGPYCRKLVASLEEIGMRAADLRRWTLAILYLLGEGPRRFSELREPSLAVTPRALTLCLADLRAAHLAEPIPVDDDLRGVAYRLTPKGQDLARVLGARAAPATEPSTRAATQRRT
jgi:DNA-binding HxlR family transcriptional regulator